MANEISKEKDHLVVLKDTDGIVYNLLEGPGKDSKYVVQAQKKLLERLQINELATDLATAGKCMLMAHCGVTGDLLQLELKVRERLESVVKLCDDTVCTLNEFGRMSDSAISNMATAYKYLTEGFEDIALETLQDVCETPTKMAIESSKLEQRFDDESTKVEKLYKATLIKRIELEKTIKTGDFVQQKPKQIADNETAEERRKIAEHLINLLDEVQDKLNTADYEAKMAHKQTETGFWAGVRRKEREEREEARKKIAEAARKPAAECRFEENVQKESLYCLHCALTALGHLQDIMQVAANFWKETHSACNAITSDVMKKLLGYLKAEVLEQRRKKLWSTRGLKMEAIKCCAQLVAIQQMCYISREYLVNSQHQVHMFVRQNPTKEQGIELLQILVKELAI